MIFRPTTKFLLSESFKELSQKKAVDKITIKEIAIKVYCYGTVCTICEFLVNPTKISAEEFANLLEGALPECLKKYLYETK